MANGHKTGGRQKGTPNKTTGQLKELLSAFLEERFPELERSFDQLPPRDKVRAFIDLLSYIVPKQQPTKEPFDWSKMEIDFSGL